MPTARAIAVIFPSLFSSTLFLASLFGSAQCLAGTGTISGTVVDAASHNGIPQSDIWVIVELGGCPSLHTTTDAGGRFSINGLEEGRYRIRAEKHGYARIEWGENAQQVRGHSILIAPGGMDQKIVFPVPRAGQIAGVVYGSGGTPLANGYVFFDDPKQPARSYSARTRADGSYWVSDLSPSSYFVSARAFSAAANQVSGDLWFFPDVKQKEQAQLVDINKQGAIADIRFGAAAPGAPLFRVTDASTGLPVPRAEVTILREGPPFRQHIDTLRTGADGTAEMRTLPDGAFIALVSRVSPPLAPWYDRDRSQGDISYFAKPLTGSETLFDLHTGASLSGTFELTSEAEKILQGGLGFTVDLAAEHSLTADPLQGLNFLTEPRQDSRSFHAEGLIPGVPYRMRLQFEHGDPLRRLCPVRITKHGELLRGDDLSANDGSPDAEALVVLIEPCAVVTGTAPGSAAVSIKRIGGAPISSALYEGPESPFHSIPVLKGQFVIRGVPQGQYQISEMNGGPLMTVTVNAGEQALAKAK